MNFLAASIGVKRDRPPRVVVCICGRFGRGQEEPPLACKYGSPTTRQATGACLSRDLHTMLLYCERFPEAAAHAVRFGEVRPDSLRLFFCSLAAFAA